MKAIKIFCNTAPGSAPASVAPTSPETGSEACCAACFFGRVSATLNPELPHSVALRKPRVSVLCCHRVKPSLYGRPHVAPEDVCPFFTTRQGHAQPLLALNNTTEAKPHHAPLEGMTYRDPTADENAQVR